MASMRKGWWTLSIMAMGIGSVAAADMPQPVYQPPPVVPAFNWTGLYVGANIGGAWSNFDLRGSIAGGTNAFNDSAFIGGGQIGYNYQFYNGFVVGVEFDSDWGGHKHATRVLPTAAGAVQASVDGPHWLSTLSGRFGWAFDRVLVYGKAGGGWLSTEASFNNLVTGAAAKVDRTATAWMMGLGFEYALAPNWTTKLEYNYLGTGNWAAPSVVFAGGLAEISGNVQVVKVGLNYKFW